MICLPYLVTDPFILCETDVVCVVSIMIGATAGLTLGIKYLYLKIMIT